MARIKLAYLGGGSSRAPGTMASFVHHGAEFDGSEFVLIDLHPEQRLEHVWIAPAPREYDPALPVGNGFAAVDPVLLSDILADQENLT